MIDHEFQVPNSKKVPKHLANDPLGTPSLSMIVGGTGQGKSLVCANILAALQKRHEFDSALFVTGNNRDPMLQSLEMPITTSPTELSDYIQNLKQSKPGTKHVLVLDDIQGSKDFNIFSGRSEFTQFILSHRHYGEDPKAPGVGGTWVIATAQTLKNSYSPVFRHQVKNWFLFYPNRAPSLTPYEEIAQDPTQMRRAMAINKSKGTHSFLYLNKGDPSEDKYYIGFKEELKDLK